MEQNKLKLNTSEMETNETLNTIPDVEEENQVNKVNNKNAEHTEPEELVSCAEFLERTRMGMTPEEASSTNPEILKNARNRIIYERISANFKLEYERDRNKVLVDFSKVLMSEIVMYKELNLSSETLFYIAAERALEDYLAGIFFTAIKENIHLTEIDDECPYIISEIISLFFKECIKSVADLEDMFDPDICCRCAIDLLKIKFMKFFTGNKNALIGE